MSRINYSIGDKVGSLINYIFISLIALSCVLPFLYVVAVSVTSENALGLYGASLFPKEFSLDAYIFIATFRERVLLSYRNTIIITALGTFLGLFVTAGVAYPMSKKDLPLRTPFMAYVLFSMLFSGGLIPLYVVIKTAGLYNSLWSLILLGMYSSWNMILMRNFFMSIPASLEESALIDGANEIQILFKIMLPLSMPIMATLGLFMAVAYWNSWFGALLFLEDRKKWPIMMFLKEIIQSTRAADKMMDQSRAVFPPSESLKMAIVVVCTLPILLVYPFVQRYFVKGIMLGSIKG